MLKLEKKTRGHFVTTEIHMHLIMCILILGGPRQIFEDMGQERGEVNLGSVKFIGVQFSGGGKGEGGQ